MITVIGWSGDRLPPDAEAALAEARLVVGGPRLLDALPVPAAARVVQTRPLAAALDALAEADGDAVVLASGDPGHFGVVRTLRSLGYPVRVLPAVGAAALLAARIGEPWEDAAVVSAHGRDPRPAANAARALPAVYVLTSPEYGPADLARDLAGWPRELTVGERLGYPDEAVTTCPAESAAGRDWRDPNVVLVRDPGRRGCGRRLVHNQPAAAPPGFALPESAFEARAAMLTKWEVRAAALARLGPTLGRLVWDIGCGSGSVAVEAARFGAAVVAVDRDPQAAELTGRNAQRHRVAVRVVSGSAPEALAGLPEPDAAFVGGGGLPALEGVLAVRPERIVATYAALEHAAAGRAALTAAGYAVEGVLLSAARLADLPDGAARLAAQNPVVLLSGTRS